MCADNGGNATNMSHNYLQPADPIRKLDLLSSETWSYKEIGEYFGVSRTTANLIKKAAMPQEGSFADQRVSVNEVLKARGTSRPLEIVIQSAIIAVKKGNFEAAVSILKSMTGKETVDFKNVLEAAILSGKIAGDGEGKNGQNAN